jgi:hypothetical protein
VLFRSVAPITLTSFNINREKKSIYSASMGTAGKCYLRKLLQFKLKGNRA